MLLPALTGKSLSAFLFFPFFACSTSSQIWPILPGVSHWIQYTRCVLILQIAVCEIHPTLSWGSSHITRNETAPHILPLFFHIAVLSGRLGLCSCEALWWKPIRQILEECNGDAVIPFCQECATVSYKYISHAGLELALHYISFLFWYKCSTGGLYYSERERMASGSRENPSLDLLISSVIMSQPMWG